MDNIRKPEFLSRSTQYDQGLVTRRFTDALESFVDKLRSDPNVIAVIAQGSIANDKVWEKSDLDIAVVVRDQKLETGGFCIDEDDLLINATLVRRTDLRSMLEKSLGGGMFIKSKVIYTEDDSIYALVDSVQQIGADDAERALFHRACWLTANMEKIEKWLYVKDDPQYAQFYVLHTADNIGAMKLLLDKKTPGREAVLDVMASYPDFMKKFYHLPMEGCLDKEQLYALLSDMQDFIIENIEPIARPLIRYMEDGEMKTVSMLSRHFGIAGFDLIHVLDFFNEIGLIERVTQPIRITAKSKKSVEEIAYIYIQNLI